MPAPLTISKIALTHDHTGIAKGDDVMARSGEAVMENVRRYRAIASLWRQTASFRPDQSWSLLEQAERWESLAVAELEAFFRVQRSDNDDRRRVASYVDSNWNGLAAAA
jgi:hypothetical protein